jgi:hypothetical protein
VASRAGSLLIQLVNARTGEPVATSVEIAATRATRRKGLLGRESLDPAAALVISPCFSVHTAFMRFAIDVVFVDRDGTVRRVARLPPWRIAVHLGASAVVELASGAARGLSVGDRVYLSCPDGAASSFAAGTLRQLVVRSVRL